MEPLLNNLTKAIGWSIFHSLWQGAIVYGILLLITIAIPKLRPRAKHNLAFGAISLIFISYCVTFFSVFKLPLSADNKGAATLTLTTEYYQYMSTLPQQLSDKAEYIFPYLAGIYGIGLAFQLLMISIGYKRMLDLKKAAHFAVPVEWKASFEKLVSQLNLRQYIGFYLSDKINVPLVIGYFKPVVLFPIGLASQLDMDQVEAILIHELSHIRRNDYLLNLFKTAIETLLFFNPFIWLSGKFINIEREHACDDLVLKFTGNPMTYAHALLKLEILKDKSTPAFCMAATGKNQHLYQRIKRITDMKTNYMNIRQQMFTIALAIATVISLAWIKPSKAEKTVNKMNQQQPIEVAGIGVKQEPPVPPQAPAAPCALKAVKTKCLSKTPSLQLPESAVSATSALTVRIPAAPEIPVCPDIALPISVTSSIKHIYQDTTKKKQKYTIITVDEKGNRKEYRSVKEMPESIRNEVMKETFNNSYNFNPQLKGHIDTIVNNSLAFMKSPEWKRSIEEITAKAGNVERYFNSADWKKQQDEIRKNAENIGAYFNSKEWRKQQENIRKRAEEEGKKAAKQQQLMRKIEAEARARKIEAEE